MTDHPPAPRECGFCGASDVVFAFRRRERDFARCRACGAFLAAPTEQEGDDDVYQDGEFLARIERDLHDEPNRAGLAMFQPWLVPGTLLEIGPGTGHFLAAAREAGFVVDGIELSERHRIYMKEKWGLSSRAEPIESEALPPASFNNVVSVNCLEHVPDPTSHLHAIARVLAPGGRVLISTCNADSAVRRMAGRYWAMFKPPDHVSIPTKRSLEAVAARADLAMHIMWTSEYPLETPVGVAVALRDWWHERRAQTSAPPAGPATSNAPGAAPTQPSGRGRLASLVRKAQEAPSFGWVGDGIARLGIAGSVKVVFAKHE